MNATALTAPAAAVFTPSLVAAPGNRVIVWVSEVNPVEAKVKVYEPTAPVNLRPSKLTKPFTALRVLVPPSTAPLPAEEETATETVEALTRLPSASRTLTIG